MPSKKSKAVTSPTKAGIQKKKSVIKKSAGKSGASSGGKSQTPKKGKAEDKKQAKSAKNVEADGLGSEANPSGIVIEACKQCNAFKTRALKLEELLKEGKEGLEVTINPVKPRRGFFEVRNGDSGEQYVSLPKMQRPFPPLKALDIDELAKEILVKINDGENA